jgi:hypothetical protein
MSAKGKKLNKKSNGPSLDDFIDANALDNDMDGDFDGIEDAVAVERAIIYGGEVRKVNINDCDVAADDKGEDADGEDEEEEEEEDEGEEDEEEDEPPPVKKSKVAVLNKMVRLQHLSALKKAGIKLQTQFTQVKTFVMLHYVFTRVFTSKYNYLFF